MADVFSFSSGAARALWLAELSQALDEAHDLTCRLGDGIVDLELMDLYIRIEAARHEIRELRLCRIPNSTSWRKDPADRPKDDPNWIGRSPWPLQRGAA